jgi:hypothetical protein
VVQCCDAVAASVLGFIGEGYVNVFFLKVYLKSLFVSRIVSFQVRLFQGPWNVYSHFLGLVNSVFLAMVMYFFQEEHISESMFGYLTSGSWTVSKISRIQTQTDRTSSGDFLQSSNPHRSTKLEELDQSNQTVSKNP